MRCRLRCWFLLKKLIRIRLVLNEEEKVWPSSRFSFFLAIIFDDSDDVWQFSMSYRIHFNNLLTETGSLLFRDWLLQNYWQGISFPVGIACIYLCSVCVTKPLDVAVWFHSGRMSWQESKRWKSEVRFAPLTISCEIFITNNFVGRLDLHTKWEKRDTKRMRRKKERKRKRERKASQRLLDLKEKDRKIPSFLCHVSDCFNSLMTSQKGSSRESVRYFISGAKDIPYGISTAPS